MNLLEKEFVPYEESVELKELEFDEPCFGGYDMETLKLWIGYLNDGEQFNREYFGFKAAISGMTINGTPRITLGSPVKSPIGCPSPKFRSHEDVPFKVSQTKSRPVSNGRK